MALRHPEPSRRRLALAAAALGPWLASGAWGPGLREARPPDRDPYFPGPGDDWQRRPPEELGFDARALAAAVDYARAHETSMPRNPGEYLARRFAGQPDQEIVGPVRERGGVNGIIVRHGYLAAEWGDTHRADMTFSVTKSYLSTLAGIARDRGLIPDLDRPVSDDVGADLFAPPHDSRITWRHLLQQTSEWEGTLWGKPDTADRRRGRDRALHEPGTFWEYNDVRVNLTALALLRVWRRPLPEVLRDEVMDPIGASDTWEWHGYRTSTVTLDGKPVTSVSGGGHWGGGLFISTRDHARFGYLFLRRGRWKERTVVSERWIDEATTPVPIQADYGLMWWLNTGGATLPSAPESSFFALGAGSTSMIWVDPEDDLVAVTRWIEGSEVDAFIRRVRGALRDRREARGAGRWTALPRCG
jgi:CubicO group peptidase (beta-lactamase class C family)